MQMQKAGAVGAKPDGKQTKMTSAAAPTCTNVGAFLVLNKTEPQYKEKVLSW